MPKKPKMKETLAAALDAQALWKTIPDFKMGDVSLNDFSTTVTATYTLAKQHANNGVERAGLKAHRDEKVRELSELVTRFRSGIRAAYGPNSALYEQSGQTRSNARKSPKRLTGAPAASNTPSTPAQPSTPATSTVPAALATHA